MKSLSKKLNKLKKKLKKIRGFTLVELLAVIIILGILLTISIPTISNALKTSKQETFVDYVESVIQKAEAISLKNLMSAESNLEDSCYMYNIKRDLGLSETGDYDGWILYSLESDKYYITIYSSDYMLLNYEFKEETTSKKQIKEKMVRYKKSTITDLESKVNEDGISSIFKIKNEDGTESAIDCSPIIDEIPSENDESTESRVFLIKGTSFNAAIKQLVSPGSSYTSEDNKIQYIKFTRTAPAVGAKTVKVSEDITKQEVIAYQKNNTVYLYTKAGTVYFPTDVSYMFYNLTMLVTITSEISDEFHLYGNEDGTTNLSHFFENDTFLTKTFDLGIFDTTKAKTLASMLKGCSALKEANVGGFNTANVKDFSYVFAGCSSLTSLDTSNWSGVSALTLSNMFQKCSRLTQINLSNFITTGLLVNLTDVFDGCTRVKKIEGLTNFDTSQVITYGEMFQDCNSVTELDLSTFKINPNVNIKMDHMFRGSNSLKYIYASYDWSDDLRKNDPDTLEMFLGCTNLRFHYYGEIIECKYIILGCSVVGHEWKEQVFNSIIDLGLSFVGLSNIDLVSGKEYLYVGGFSWNTERLCALTYRANPHSASYK